MSRKYKSITNQKFGRLTAIKWHSSNKFGLSKWECICDCGNNRVVLAGDLISGHTKSCGCFRREETKKLGLKSQKHGHAKNGKITTEYLSWVAMKQRCLNPNVPFYDNYGGRGITICKRWLKFENFIEDMGLKPNSTYSLDRIDVNGNYTLENCRWTSARNQLLNRRSLQSEYKRGFERGIKMIKEQYGLL